MLACFQEEEEEEELDELTPQVSGVADSHRRAG